jgi:cardiolipin synthase
VTAPILTVANQLTILRMALVPALVVMVLRGEMGWALGIFAVAAVTDLLDGFIARWGHQQTRLGAMLDPVADKLLIGSALVSLTWAGDLFVAIPSWLTVTTLCRDGMLVIAVVIVNLVVERRVFYPTWLGKLSSFLHVLTVGAVLVANVVERPLGAFEWLFPLTLVLSLVSAYQYVYRASTRRPEEVA